MCILGGAIPIEKLECKQPQVSQSVNRYVCACCLFLECACFQLMTWPCGLMDKALVFGTKDCRFESCQGHFSRFANPSCLFNGKSGSFVSRFANPSCSSHRKQSLLLHLCYLGKSIKELKSHTSTVQQKYITVLQSR